MSAKKELLEKCKHIVDQVKLNEQEVAKKLSKISSDVSTQLEIERKTFRSGQESRQRKVCGSSNYLWTLLHMCLTIAVRWYAPVLVPRGEAEGARGVHPARPGARVQSPARGGRAGPGGRDGEVD
jgi:hypothetical protein